MNVSATLSAFKLFYNPSLCLPHSTISSFQQLPIPLSRAFKDHNGNAPDIRAVVLDKDNCFARPRENEVYKPYTETFETLRAAYPGPHLLIVSNSSGTNDDAQDREASLLEANTGVAVLRHSTKKPGAHPAILSYFLDHPHTTVGSPSQIAIVGDRLLTDMMMANMMGAWGLWVRDGVDVSKKGASTFRDTRMIRRGLGRWRVGEFRDPWWRISQRRRGICTYPLAEAGLGEGSRRSLVGSAAGTPPSGATVDAPGGERVLERSGAHQHASSSQTPAKAETRTGPRNVHPWRAAALLCSALLRSAMLRTRTVGRRARATGRVSCVGRRRRRRRASNERPASSSVADVRAPGARAPVGRCRPISVTGRREQGRSSALVPFLEGSRQKAANGCARVASAHRSALLNRLATISAPDPPRLPTASAKFETTSADPMDLNIQMEASEEFMGKASSTPSPAASTGAGSSAARRPSRKSTLTQQQKNQKRQRATQDQLITLEVEFNKNPTPTAPVRERIAQDINMTERSVQIWFQNRRAKIKLLAKKSIETGEDCDAIPDSMRQYLAIQAAESGKPVGRNFLGRTGEPVVQYGSGNMLLNGESNNPGKVVIHHFSCRALSIGSWRRVGQNAMDLVIFYSPEKASITYYINNDSAGYKIEYPFSYIKNIVLDNGDMSSAKGAPSGQKPGGLVVELNRPPLFFMDSSGSGGFYQCGDFTEGQQASQTMHHHLGGNPKVLSGQLAKLCSLESFKTRNGLFEHPTLSASAPVSPGLHRPASQPNHVSHPHVGMFQESQYGVNLHPARGHKRQRSRSVPIAVDFSMLQNPATAFNFQQEQQQQQQQHQHQHQHHLQSPQLYAPVPHHHHHHNHAPQPNFGPLGPNLRIDTSSGYGLDYRPFPLSAATTSPSEYASPSFFTTGASAEPMTASNFQTPYSLPFLSPMVDSTGAGGPSVSPLSAMSHGDPVIANQSPPLSSMHRSASADMFATSHDPANMSEEGLSLTELYSKQSLNFSMPSPHTDGSPEDLAMQSMVTFDHVDHTGLSPDHSTM
ncbi:MAG: hypothetical protein M1837_007442 [Sclerophora amabilis]|nr:MAG: hypothetical protein M1837_007442 [Sclerophora amabilis]